MFTKFLFLVLLGCALAFATPSGPSYSIRERRNAGDKVKEWWHGVEEKIKNFYGNLKESFTNFWNKITGKAKKEADRQKLIELQNQYESLKDESAQAVEAKKAEWDKILEENERRLNELKKQANLDVEKEIKTWDRKFDQLKDEAEDVINTL